MAETTYLVAAFACAGVGAYWDCRTRRIPNWLTASAFVLGSALHGLLGGWRDILTAMLAGLVAGTVFLVFFLAGGMGGGDVKLIAAVTACAGWDHVVTILIATALAGGLLALVLAVAGRKLRQTLSNVLELVIYHSAAGLRPHPGLNLDNPETLRLPYGIAIGVGTGMALVGLLMEH